jgi:hypothetical protein
VLPALITALVAILTASSQAADPVAVFHVGNSLTDQAYGMHDIAKARGHETKFGRHMIPGAPLDWLWNHRNEGLLDRRRNGKTMKVRTTQCLTHNPTAASISCATARRNQRTKTPNAA